MKKILHICSDEKFIDFAITNFNAITHVKNDFVVISKEKSLKYIKSKHVTIKSKSAFLLQILFSRLREYDAVVFHSLNDVFKLFVKFIPKRLNICWIGFGFDYYDYNQIVPERVVAKKGMKSFIKNKVLNLDASYQRINYFCPVLESEFLPALTRLKLNAKYIDWNYGSSNALIEKLKNEYVHGDSILLGNSADPTNNHIEIIEELINIDEKREVIIPLSYAGSPEYIAKVLTKLKRSKLNYTILERFMEQEAYFQILKKCSFVIMNQKRQQAVGNIIMMLSLGAKVILDKDNPVYEYLVNMGFEVFDNSDLFNPLSSKLAVELQNNNKALCLSNYSDENTNIKTKQLINAMLFSK